MVKMKIRGLLLVPPISLNICSVESLTFPFTFTTQKGEMEVIENVMWKITGKNDGAHGQQEKNHNFFFFFESLQLIVD